MSRALVLNATYEPLSVVPSRRAVVLVLEHKAELLHDAGDVIHSERLTLPVPSVIRLRAFVKVPFRRRAPLNRRGIFARDDQRCQYCGAAAESIDHVIPRSRGGQHSWDNVVAACRPCNVRKRDRLLPETTMRLRRNPDTPRDLTWVVVAVGHVPTHWEPYLHPATLSRVTWAVEVRPGPPADLHARPIPEPLTRTVWVADPTVPTLVLGSTQPEAVVDRDACARAGVAVARRRSGGGAVLVEPGRVLWLDVLLPAGDPLWTPDVGHAFLWLGEVWRDALVALGVPARVHEGGLCRSPWSRLVCFGGLGTGEVVDDDGLKLVGLSQRRTRAGARFQCMVMGEWDPEAVVSLLALSPEDRAEAIAALATAARPVPVPLDELRSEVLTQLRSR